MVDVLRFFVWSCLALLLLDLVGGCILSTLEQEDGHLSQVEVDEMSRLVSHITPKVAPNNTVPSGVVLLVELLLDERRNVLLNVVLLQRLCGAVDCILLHLLRHVSILDHGLPFCHCGGSSSALLSSLLPLKGRGGFRRNRQG